MPLRLTSNKKHRKKDFEYFKNKRKAKKERKYYN